MEIVDMQLHETAPLQTWQDADVRTRHGVLSEVLLQMVDAIGVDAVALHPIEEVEWAFSLAQVEPRRFGVIPAITGGDPDGVGAKAIKPDAPDLEEQIAELARTEGVLGVRVVPSPHFYPEEFTRFENGGYDDAFAACAAHGLPVLLMISGHPAAATRVAEKFPELSLILDHLGLAQPPLEPPDDPRWAQLSSVTDLARYPNVSLKVCHPIALSEETEYPFADVWPYLHRLLETFGPERLAWASDIGRFRGRMAWNLRSPTPEEPYLGKHNYMESLAFFLYTDELSTGDKEQILGRTARRLLNWPVTPAGAED